MKPIVLMTTALLAATFAGITFSAEVCRNQRSTSTRPRVVRIKGFAIAGLFDIDDDGKTDVDLIRRMIRHAGSTIDAEIDIDGKTTGRLRRDTAYLIVGKLPERTSVSPIVARDFDAFMRRATELGIEVIHLRELLEIGSRPSRTENEAATKFRPRPVEGRSGRGAY